jgi:hypothetical protein
MPVRIAIIGWGSLTWDLDDLAPKVEGAWRMRAGPRLQMEFSRVSLKRKMGLVVCLDAESGVPCATHVIGSIRPDLAGARLDLAFRERAPIERIGWANSGGEGESRLPQVVAAVSGWCRVNGCAGAVWTDLEPNFRDSTGRDFSIAAGRAYLRGLAGESLAEAHRYIRNAPWTTRTPMRRALAADPWWRGLRAGAVRNAPD